MTIALLGYAAACRVRFPRVSYWWLALGLLVVLSGGAAWTFDPVTVRLPGHWLWDYVFLFRMIRSHARFNLLAAVVAAVLASAGMRHFLARFRSRAARGVACGVVGIVALVDLSVVPFANGGEVLPEMPACYEFIKRQDPMAALVDVPQFLSDTGTAINAACTYWQSLHHCRTTAGYSGVPNAIYDNTVYKPSPFAYACLANPGNLAKALAGPPAVDIRDYIWLYLTSRRIRYVVVHTDARLLGLNRESRRLVDTGALDKLRGQLEHAKVFEDEKATVYDRERLERPRRWMRSRGRPPQAPPPLTRGRANL